MHAPQARELALSALSRYWQDAAPIRELSLPQPDWPGSEPLPPVLSEVALPDWAADLGVDGALFVPAHRVAPGDGAPWQRTDWLGAAAWYVNGSPERAHEARHGPIHSYAFRLRGWDPRMWQYAWVNRIALFLRRWTARHANANETELHGLLPDAELLLTHDIDAIAVTGALRFKQASMHCLNAARLILGGKPRAASHRLASAWRFLGRRGALWHLDDVAAAERVVATPGYFFAYGGLHRSLRQRLFDPHYDIATSHLADTLRGLHHRGFGVGLHQSFDSWRDAGGMAEEKQRLESALGFKVHSCRQHWLRFSWRETWEAQEDAGFFTDATLGFNDRPGFRNGAALRFHPWSEARSRPLALVSVPMVLMDSQLLDYGAGKSGDLRREIERWLGEVRRVHGVASVISHPHTLGPEYGWRPAFEAMLSGVAGTAK